MPKKLAGNGHKKLSLIGKYVTNNYIVKYNGSWIPRHNSVLHVQPPPSK